MCTPVIIIHPPKSKDGQDALQKQTAAVHASGVIRQLRELPVPADEKRARLQTILHTYKSNREQT